MTNTKETMQSLTEQLWSHFRSDKNNQAVITRREWNIIMESQAALRAWAEDEQQKRYRAEESLMDARSEIARDKHKL